MFCTFFTFHFLFLSFLIWGVVGGGLLGSGPHYIYLISFLTFLLFGSLYLLQASVYKFLLERRPLWSPLLTQFSL